MLRFSAVLALGSVLTLAGVVNAQHQQVRVGTPLQRQSHSFYENIGSSFSINRMGPRGGWFFNGPGQPGVPFGLGDPGSDARFGIQGRNGNTNFNLGLNFGQGSDSSNSVQLPSVVIPNGGQGFISDTIQRPFVTGVVPVVGASRPTVTSPLRLGLQRLQQEGRSLGDAIAQQEHAAAEAAARSAAAPRPRGLRSTANHGDLSVAEIKRQQAAENATTPADEVAMLIEKGKGQEAQGKIGVALIYYQQASSRADGQMKRYIDNHIYKLKKSR